MWPFSKRSGPAPEADPRFGADYAAILESLQKLRKTKSAQEVFGASAHRFRLNPPLDERIIAQFESSHRVRLPADYRGFLVHVGNGGAGPGYGLFKFREMDDGHDTRSWQENDHLVGTLSQPFPHSGAWNDLTGRPEIDESVSRTEAEEDTLMAEVDAWEQNHYWHTRYVNGAIPICHLGCALRQWLIITGDESGHVWNDYRADGRGILPVQIGSTHRVSFLGWYRSWLADALQQVANA